MCVGSGKRGNDGEGMLEDGVLSGEFIVEMSGEENIYRVVGGARRIMAGEKRMVTTSCWRCCFSPRGETRIWYTNEKLFAEYFECVPFLTVTCLGNGWLCTAMLGELLV